MSVHVCRRCGIPVWSPTTRYCMKCWEHFARQADALPERGKKA